jgi:hypothetical protein
MLFAIRSRWSRSPTQDFTWLYKWLYEEYVETITSQHIGDVLITIAEYMYRDRLSILKEVNATACIAEIMSTLEVEIDLESPF